MYFKMNCVIEEIEKAEWTLLSSIKEGKKGASHVLKLPVNTMKKKLKKEACEDKMEGVALLCNINTDSNNRKKDKLSKPAKYLIYSTNLTDRANLSAEVCCLLNNVTPKTKVLCLCKV